MLWHVMAGPCLAIAREPELGNRAFWMHCAARWIEVLATARVTVCHFCIRWYLRRSTAQKHSESGLLWQMVHLCTHVKFCVASC